MHDFSLRFEMTALEALKVAKCLFDSGNSDLEQIAHRLADEMYMIEDIYLSVEKEKKQNVPVEVSRRVRRSRR